MQVVDETDVLVIGAGVIGSAITYYAAKAGIQCLLIDRGRSNGEASGTNAGNIHIQVNQHGTNYTSAFMEQIRIKILLHKMARDVWMGLEEELDSDLGRRMPGGLIVAQTPSELESLTVKSAFEREIGINTVMLDRKQLDDLAPGLSPDLIGASFLQEEGFANPLLLAPAFIKRATELQARVKTHCAVMAINRRDDGFEVLTERGTIRARRIVNAAGAWSATVARMVGIDLPISGRVLQMLVTEPSRPKLPFLMQHAHRRLTMKQTNYGTFLIGGGWPGVHVEGSGNFTERESIVGSAHVAASVYPDVGKLRLLRSWAGMLVRTPGNLPILGEVPGVPNFFAAVVTSGFSVGAASGQIMADLLSGRTPQLDIDPYHPRHALAEATRIASEQDH